MTQSQFDSMKIRLLQLLRSQKSDALRRFLETLHPVEAARLVSALTRQQQRLLFGKLNSNLAAGIVERLEEHEQRNIVGSLSPHRAGEIVEFMDSNDAADVLGELPKDAAEAILSEMSDAAASRARELIAYPPNSAGSIMATEFIALPEDTPAPAALRKLAKTFDSLGAERATYVYTVDRFHRLTGVLQLRQLVMHQKDNTLRGIRNPDVKCVPDDMPKAEVAKMFRDYKFLALPVVNAQHVLVGVITIDDVMDLIREISSEEMMKMQGVAGDETRSMPVLVMARRRVGWLSLNILLNLLAASVIAAFTETLQAAIALAVFLPIISDMSGVSGMQGVAVSIRDLALGKVRPAEVWNVLWKEIRIGLLNGLVLGLEIGIVAYLWKKSFFLGGIVAVSLWLNTILAVCLGSCLPLLAKRVGLDPAIASGPILTTVTDLMGFFILLSLATAWLPKLIG